MPDWPRRSAASLWPGSTTSLSNFTDVGPCLLGHFASSEFAPLLAIAAFVLGGLVVFPVLVLIAATAAALGPWLGFVSAAAGVLLSSLVLFGIGRVLGHVPAATAAWTPLVPHSEPHHRQGRRRRRHDPHGADRAIFDRECGGGRQQAASARFHARNGARHGARHRGDGCIGGADRGSGAQCVLGECAAAWLCYRCLDRGVPRRAVPGDLAGGTKNVTGCLRIMTWNVHGTFNLNPKFDLDGVCSLIRHWSPDVVALQEVDSRGRSDDPFVRLAEAVGDHRVDARSIVTKDGDYGQALFSRWPSPNRLRLSTSRIRSASRGGPLPRAYCPMSRARSG